MCVLFFACAGAQAPAADPTATSNETDIADPRPASTAEYKDDGATEDSGKWRWGGSRQDCFFKYDNECYSDLSAACKAAGCAGDACHYDGAAPANVSCH